MLNLRLSSLLRGASAVASLLCVGSLTLAAPYEKETAHSVHRYEDGETLSSIAKQYHVSVQQLLDANDNLDPDKIRNHTKIVIPHKAHSSKTHAAKSSEQNSFAKIKGEGVAVRVAPDADKKLVTRLDKGERVTILAERDGWGHVKTGGGDTGWVRLDYLKGAKKKKSAETEETANPVSLAKREKPELAKKKSVKIAKTKAKSHEDADPETLADASEEVTPRHADLVRKGLSYRGTPYRWGGASRGGFDCSGFTSYLYGLRGVSLPHSARAQFTYGHAVSRDALKEGDLVFFHTVTPGISHVGMYIGGGRFVHASSRRSGGVRTDTLESGYYRERLVGARRILK